MLETGGLDLMGCLLYSNERSETFSYSALAAGQTFTSLFVRTDSPLTSSDLGALKNVTVAACMASLNDDDLNAYAAESAFEIGGYLDCATIDEVEAAVVSGKADAGVIGSYQPSAETRIIASFAPRAFYFATSRENPSVKATLNQAMNAILIDDPYYAQGLAVKYRQTYSGKAVFSEKELDYIENAAPLKVSFSDVWYPLIQYDAATGQVFGTIPDIFDKISDASGLFFEYYHADSHEEAVAAVASGQCDLLACSVYSAYEAERNGFDLTDTYLSVSLTQIGKTSRKSQSMKVGTLAGFPEFGASLKGENIEYLYYDSTEACLEALRQNEVDEVVVNSYSAGYYLSLSRYTNLIRASLQGVALDACVGVSRSSPSNELLLSVLNKALSSISDAQVNESLLSHTIESGNSLESMINRIPTMTVVMVTLALLLLIVLLLVFFIGYIRKTKQARNAANEAKNKAEEAKDALERINRLLEIDELTGALSENGFSIAARKSLADFPDRQWFLVDFDIDGFEHFNALHGFEKGNETLIFIAQTCEGARRGEGELFARIHADHFAALLCAPDVEALKSRILETDGVLRSTDQNQSLLFSYGVYQIESAELPVSFLRDKAQAAKRLVKGNYENFISVFDESVHHRQLEDAALVADMEKGLALGEFVAFYQPKYDVNTGRINSAEALVRWMHQNKCIPPDRFIGLFEKNGLISKLDFFMLETVCKRLRALIDAGVTVLPVSLNFSRNHLYDSSFLSKLLEVVERYRVPPSLLVVEFTEYACLEDGKPLYAVINGLHAMGIQVSIDDFGSGYSSLNILKEMPFDEVKLDRGFLSGATNKHRGDIVIATVLWLANRLNFRIVAEGVETQEQLDFLRKYGCQIAQGYYFSRPVSSDDYERLLQAEVSSEAGQ